MFVEEPQLVVGCALKAHDDASLERLLLGAIKNWLIDQAKATEVGKLRRRVQNVLSEDARFVSSKCGQLRWALTDNASTVWQGEIDRPCAAARGVHGVQITRWNTSGPTPRETCARKRVKLASSDHDLLWRTDTLFGPGNRGHRVLVNACK
jgi:hypothetical protein